jgi:phosphoribosylaminoimidazolecarboxamide formyltransferase/IMP cyclohydrolase
MGKISTALISVTDKSGVVEFARSLEEAGIEILSTGGTAQTLRDGGITVTEISEYTGFPEMMDGRVKTLHPKVHGGLLARRDNRSDTQMMQAHGIKDIGLVVVNLYQFEQTVAKEGCTVEEAVENIDIGGPSMLRSAAKNFRDVTVIIDTSDYHRVVEEIAESGGTTLKTRFELAKKVFRLTWQYDRAISDYLEGVTLQC